MRLAPLRHWPCQFPRSVLSALTALGRRLGRPLAVLLGATLALTLVLGSMAAFADPPEPTGKRQEQGQPLEPGGKQPEGPAAGPNDPRFVASKSPPGRAPRDGPVVASGAGLRPAPPRPPGRALEVAS